MNNLSKMKNGEAKTASGYKSVAFDKDTLEICPVLYRVYSGHVPGRGTVQGVSENSIIANITWNPSNTLYSIYRFSMDNLTEEEQDSYWIRLNEKYPWLEEWLEKAARSETILPEDVVPPSEYLSTKVKFSRISSTLERFGLPFKAKQFVNSRKCDLQFTPRKLDRDLDSYNDIGITTSIFGSFGNGTKAVELERNSGIIGWRKWKFIIRIREGVYISGDENHGMSIDIWINPEVKSLKKERSNEILYNSASNR